MTRFHVVNISVALDQNQLLNPTFELNSLATPKLQNKNLT